MLDDRKLIIVSAKQGVFTQILSRNDSLLSIKISLLRDFFSIPGGVVIFDGIGYPISQK